MVIQHTIQVIESVLLDMIVKENVQMLHFQQKN